MRKEGRRKCFRIFTFSEVMGFEIDRVGLLFFVSYYYFMWIVDVRCYLKIEMCKCEYNKV